MIYNEVIMETNELESDVQFLERVLADMMPLDTHEKIALRTPGLWYRVEINNETSNEQDTNTV